MCGRYAIFTDEEIGEINDIIQEVNEKCGNSIKMGEIFPTNAAPVLAGENGAIAPTVMNWGFPGFQNKGVIINARAETAAEKRTFRDSLFTRRCVIPSSGFYEWAHTEGKKQKDKYLFRMPRSSALYMAGFFNEFKVDGVPTRRFIILTTAPNSSIEEIHNRMPVVLPKDKIHDWIENTEAAIDLLEQVPPELIKLQV